MGLEHLTEAFDTHDALVKLLNSVGDLLVLLCLLELLLSTSFSLGDLFSFASITNVPDFTIITTTVASGFVYGALPGGKTGTKPVLSIDEGRTTTLFESILLTQLLGNHGSESLC